MRREAHALTRQTAKRSWRRLAPWVRRAPGGELTSRALHAMGRLVFDRLEPTPEPTPPEFDVRFRPAPPSHDHVVAIENALHVQPARAIKNTEELATLPNSLVSALEQAVINASNDDVRLRAASRLSRGESDEARRAVARLSAHARRRMEFEGRSSRALHDVLHASLARRH